jgi:hypothetical protein
LSLRDANTGHDSPAALTVELDIFSGMPNPTWTVAGHAAHQLLDTIAALRLTPPRTLRTQLGYRGFVVRLPDDDGERVMRVQAGTVEISSGPSVEYFSDVERKLERDLLRSGESTLSPETAALVARELGE